MSAPQISERKADHIELCATGDVGFRAQTTLLEQVELMHDALPELAIEEIDLGVELFGKRLRAPLFVAAMTGGTPRAREINRELAALAEERGYGFGLGSQRAMLDGDRAATYEVRDVAPTALVLGNIGAVQAAGMSTKRAHELVTAVGADALCVHMNPAMEIVQPGGDRDFRGALAALERLGDELGVPVIAKETGCGIGPRAAAKLASAGIRHVDVSGAGGTSWVAVEAARAHADARALGEAFRDWGVPTAASILFARAARPRFKTVIATGGIATGLDVARAIALGADASGIARPVLQALLAGGRSEAEALLARVEAELRAAMLLVGARDLESLRGAPKSLRSDLARYAELARREAKTASSHKGRGRLRRSR